MNLRFGRHRPTAVPIVSLEDPNAEQRLINAGERTTRIRGLEYSADHLPGVQPEDPQNLIPVPPMKRATTRRMMISVRKQEK